MAKSRRPSPLKSAVTITPGWLTKTGDVAVENVPSPLPNRIVTVLSLRFTTARSSSPSLLKSPRTSVKGPCPTGIGEPEAGLNVAIAIAKEDADGVSDTIAHSQICLAVAVEIGRDNASCKKTHGNR